MTTRLFSNAPVVFGRGSLAHLEQLDGQRAAVVTDDGAMEKLGFLEQALNHLETATMETQVVARIAAEPTTDDIDSTRLALADFKPDWIVAIGGGSVLDSAKAMWVINEYPKITWEEAFQFNALPPLTNTKMAAVPSTSGTGSETSRVSVIIDAKTQLKRLLFSPEIIPSLAILDPALPENMPIWLTAASALDALSHAIECSIATIAHEFTVSLAIGAIRLIFKHLPSSYQIGDLHAREQLHYAATISGMAINNSTAGLAHAMDQVGPLFGVPHGVVCSVLLPYTLAFLFDSAYQQYAKMGQAIGLTGNNEQELALAFLKELMILQRRVDLPLSFKDAGVDEGGYMNQMELMIESVTRSGSTRLSPRIPSIEETRQLFVQAYYGNLPEVYTR